MNYMTDVRVRNLDEWVVDALRTRACANRRSLEGELRELLRQEALRPKQELADELHTMLDELRHPPRPFSDSAAIIREMRDERG